MIRNIKYCDLQPLADFTQIPLRELVRQQDVRVAVAFTPMKDPAGFICVRPAPDGLLIEHIAVHPAVHRQHIGTMLSIWAEVVALDKGLTSVIANVPERMYGAQAFFTALDFKKVQATFVKILR